MGRSSLWCVLIFLLHLFPLLLLTEAGHKRNRGGGGLKSLDFSLYQHETINKTGFIVVEGVAAGGAGVSQTTTPFGTVFVFRDHMTTGLGASSSRVAGIAEGTSITSSLDGLRSLSVAKITLDVEGCQGSVSIVGGTHNTKPSDYPVVGGTGDFLFVQGYVRLMSPQELTDSLEQVDKKYQESIRANREYQSK